jgi:dTMP kinase
MIRRKGLFILFEGIDGSGKSTQCDMLYSYADTKGIDCVKLYEPTGGEWGIKIRKMLSMGNPPPIDKQINLFIRDRADDVSMNIKPALDTGKTIIMDRYFYSNAAYQGCDKIPPEEIIRKNMELNFPIPDRVYFLDIDPERAIDRIKKRSTPDEMEIFEKLSFQQQVRKNFYSIIDDKFMVINGDDDPEKIFTKIADDFSALLKERL